MKLKKNIILKKKKNLSKIGLTCQTNNIINETDITI